MATGYNPQTWAQMRQSLVTLYNAALLEAGGVPCDDSPGSEPNAIFNSAATLFYYQQEQFLYVQSLARLGTSADADADSFVNPFGIIRQAASPSGGAVLCTTPSDVASQLVVPVGGVFTTGSGLQFVIVADETNTAYSEAAGGYVIGPSGTSVSVTVVCQTAGTVGNVQANTITQIYGASGVPPITGISTVTNPLAFTNGLDRENLAQLTNRFAIAESSGDVATGNALAAALLDVQPGLTYSIGDLTVLNLPAPQPPIVTFASGGSLAARTRFFCVTYLNPGGETLASTEFSIVIPVNNLVTVTSPPPYANATAWNVYESATSGTETKQNASPITIGTNWTEPSGGMISGAAKPATNSTTGSTNVAGYVTIPVNVLGQSTGPSQTLINAVQGAVNAVKAAGDTILVVAPTLVTINVVAVLHIDSTANAAAITTPAAAAAAAFINNIGLDPEGGTTVCSLIDLGTALRDITGVNRVSGLTLNGGTADISAGFNTQLVAGTITLTTTSP